jgi:hypothetical protein
MNMTEVKNGILSVSVVLMEEFDNILEDYDTYNKSGDYSNLVRDLAAKSFPINGPRGALLDDELNDMIEAVVEKKEYERPSQIPWPDRFHDLALGYDGPHWSRKKRNCFKMMRAHGYDLQECVSKWTHDASVSTHAIGTYS